MCNNIAHELILDRTSSLLFKIDTFMILEHITSDLLETPEHIFYSTKVAFKVDDPSFNQRVKILTSSHPTSNLSMYFPKIPIAVIQCLSVICPFSRMTLPHLPLALFKIHTFTLILC